MAFRPPAARCASSGAARDAELQERPVAVLLGPQETTVQPAPQLAEHLCRACPRIGLETTLDSSSRALVGFELVGACLQFSAVSTPNLQVKSQKSINY